MKFNCSIATQAFLESVYARAHVRNKSVLGRSAIFLALGEGVPAEFQVADAQGVDLDEDTILGEGLKAVVRTALNQRAGHQLEEGHYRSEFRRHLEYGCQRLGQIWESTGQEPRRFVKALLEIAGKECTTRAVRPAASVVPLPVVEQAVKLKLLRDAEEWLVNEAGHNGLLVISGKPGSGKSQLALDLLAQAARQGLRFVFFDLKGELAADPNNPQQQKNRAAFLELTQAESVQLIRQALPINPLVREATPAANAQVAYEIAALVRAFAPQLGARQERMLAEAFQRLEGPDFAGLAEELKKLRATGVELALVKKIVALNLFASAQTGVSPEEWLKSSLVIDFKAFHNDNGTKALAVALILNFLMKRLNRNQPVKDGLQPLKMVLFVDEAHLLLPKEGKAGLLSALARQGRSWGFPLWLASQDADAFVTTGTNGTNFAELASCGVHFSPETLREGQQRKILGSVLSRELGKGEAAVRRMGKLETGVVRQFWKEAGR